MAAMVTFVAIKRGLEAGGGESASEERRPSGGYNKNTPADLKAPEFPKTGALAGAAALVAPPASLAGCRRLRRKRRRRLLPRR